MPRPFWPNADNMEYVKATDKSNILQLNTKRGVSILLDRRRHGNIFIPNIKSGKSHDSVDDTGALIPEF